MVMQTAPVIHACEKLYTLTKRAAVSDDRDARRAEVIARFEIMATVLGKIATRFRAPDWMRVHEAVVHCHTEAVQADERRQATFAHAGSEAALVTSMHALAAVLGFTLADAATAAEDAANDDAAAAAVENRQAAE
jgi:predicted NAD-dependent protein-ADP-ribosyltransferase YbiA (DUF1768 family)